METLKTYFGEDQGYNETPSRQSGLFSLKFTHDGLAVVDSLVLASEAWFIGRVLSGQDWTYDFDSAQMDMRDRIRGMLGGVITAATIVDVTRMIRKELGVEEFFGDIDSFKLRFRSKPVNANKIEQEDDPLNSMILRDLTNVASQIHRGEVSEPLSQYLFRHDESKRLDLDGKEAVWPLINQLLPDRYPPGCWPSEGHIGLVHSQQVAVNTILKELGDSAGIVGVNGPPGTGKTTLLRDLIAAVIVRRADAMARFDRPSHMFQENAKEDVTDEDKTISCFKLKPQLFGFEIVIASSNNGAVENVSLELPQRDKVDELWLEELDHFADLGEILASKPAWGLISGALGRKDLRKAFVDGYFYGRKPEKKVPAEEQENAPDDPDASPDQLFLDDGMVSSVIGEDDASHTDEKPRRQRRGFEAWIEARAEENARRDTSQRQALWKAAVKEYQDAKTAVDQIQAYVNPMRKLLSELQVARETVATTELALIALRKNAKEVDDELSDFDARQRDPAATAMEEILVELENYLGSRPGFWANLFSLGKKKKLWTERRTFLDRKLTAAEKKLEHVDRVFSQLITRQKNLSDQILTTEQQLADQKKYSAEKQTDSVSLAVKFEAKHLILRLREEQPDPQNPIEMLEPWKIDGWREARARVFIKALKLHRTFFSLEASRMRSNLKFINRILTGGRFESVSDASLRSVWASLFMLVPVLSSTFASFARTFGSLGKGDIGWLLVDEAGQAPPQAAVGALWRAKRAVLVGDTFQLKPIINVSNAALEHMRKRYGVDPYWIPKTLSAQILADAATRWGRLVGPTAHERRWAGLPLVVHRRCDRPMYDIANRIAYGGAMVYGTKDPSPERETPASIVTGWIDVKGPSNGNWVPEEGNALHRLLQVLHEDGVANKDISVITPFRAVRDELPRYVFDEMVSGTIHTMQGKESDVVILVLGGSSHGGDARGWAVAEPNLINVAVTRAKRRLYVIGDRDSWCRHPLFAEVMDWLPVQALPIPKKKASKGNSAKNLSLKF
ncbi:DEAD/DEAH box helicase [Herbaspirillum seropedicae]|uniref:DEAD/DEAH box helicase n=1 Tax=Herbaspirillum seropedicae TaxID=964 RepID=UPI001E53013F|nr:AAA domain-containing protein [Herbaspirillum seropedicae]